MILEAVLSEDGLLTNVRSLRDAGEAFVEAALAAVRQWTYSPARLNGRPVAVIATITISYSRAG